ncbi:unnamed protein product [Candidula unifasciata]|uniref:Brain tumor protein n=1 Tax=Candidula unifasciata TaxID=100452 RepID=A0A8S3YPI7_9EUPU|nr:unnamed protein product [Candidula unifasciata]
MSAEIEHLASPTMEAASADDDRTADGLNGALEDDQSVDICRLCESTIKSPKILSCLHEFCEECLKKKLESEKEENGLPTSPLAKEWMMDVIRCPICEQKTRLPDKGVSGLLSDTVLEDLIESNHGGEKQIGCTSCKAGDNAVAKCRTCENLLCPNCVTAHQFMRCFEDHKVVTFEEMINTGEGTEHLLSRPVFCTIHIVESIKFFCTSCLVPACGECIQKSHNTPDHIVKQLAEVVGAKKETLADFTKECGKKLVECQKMNANLNAAFEELEMQKDNTKGLILETFQSYKALLEDIRDKFIAEAEQLHEKRELCLMERMHKLSTYENQLSQAKSFVERICQHGHAGQIGQLLQPMLTQLNTLCMGFIMPDIPINTEFKTDAAAFMNAVRSAFGYFSREKNSSMSGSSVCSPFEAERFSLPNMLALGGGNMMHHHMSHDLMNINSLPGLPMNIGMSQRMDSLPMSSVISSFNSMNMSHHPDHTVSGNNSPLSDSGISVDNVSHSSGSNTAAMMNVAAMAKLHQSQSPLFAPGMSMGGPGAALMAANGAITSGAGDNALASILGSNNAGSNANANTVQNANIEGLASLLNQPPPSALNTFTNVGTFDQFSPTSVPSELGSPGSQYGGEPYPALRRTNKMNAMQISRFPGTIGDTEIGHWGPQQKQINEVPLRCKFGQLGPGKGQFNSPHGFCLGVDEDIVVADTNNHRIQVFQKTGDFKYQFGIPGREEGQLWYPRKVAVMLKTGKFVVCDRGNERSRMQIFNRNGHFLKKIAIRYIDIVAGLAITPEGHIVAVDSVSPTVFVISESGDLIKWFDCSDFMREPSDIAINNNEYFVCDFKGHCVVVFARDGTFMRRIGCENITNYPNGIDISGHGDVLIGDSHGNRFHVGVFQREGSLISEFQCPYVKVSRCCGLKITTEGYIVTLAKNNHHVLVLNTLYIP